MIEEENKLDTPRIFGAEIMHGRERYMFRLNHAFYLELFCWFNYTFRMQKWDFLFCDKNVIKGRKFISLLHWILGRKFSGLLAFICIITIMGESRCQTLISVAKSSYYTINKWLHNTSFENMRHDSHDYSVHIQLTWHSATITIIRFLPF